MLMEPFLSALSSTAQEPAIVHVDASLAPLVPKFMANRMKEVTTIREALTAQDFVTVSTVAHGMKGAAGTYGFETIGTMAATIENAAKQRMSQTIGKELASLGSYLERVEVIFDGEESGESRNG